MTREELRDALVALDAKATRPPWKHDWRSGEMSEGNITNGWHDIAIVMGANYGGWRDTDDGGEAEFEANGDLIVLLRNNLPTILASLDTEAVKAEREACAKVARSYEDALRPPASWSDEQKDWWETGVADAAGAIESAIRARMEQP